MVAFATANNITTDALAIFIVIAVSTVAIAIDSVVAVVAIVLL